MTTATLPSPTDLADPITTSDVRIDQIDRSPLETADGRTMGNFRVGSKADEAAIAELMAGLRTPDDLLQPVRVYAVGDQSHLADGEKNYILGYGFRRCEAFVRKGWPTIRAEIRSIPLVNGQPDWAIIARARAIENLHRQSLNAVEEGVMVANMLATHDGSVERVAAELGKSPTWVRDRSYLERLSVGCIGALMEGRLLLGHAREIAKLDDFQQQETLAAWCEVKEDGTCGFTLERLRGEVKKRLRSLKTTPWDQDKKFAGKRPCVGCEHNSLNGFLFEHDGDGAAYCLNAECFSHKAAAAQKKIAKAANNAVNQDIKSTAAAVKEVTPEGIDPARVAREAKKLRGEDLPVEKAPEAAAPDPNEEAYKAWDVAVQEWAEKAQEAILEHASGHGDYIACLVMLGETSYRVPGKSDSDSNADLVKHLCDGSVGKMANEVAVGKWCPEVLSELTAEHLDQIASAWDVKGLERMPRVEDFLPKAEPEIHTIKKSLLSPAQKQYQQLKSKHPDYVLFFRMGDFYELFFEDAKLGASVLGIHLTTRQPPGADPMPMVGIPFHAVEGYIRRMIQAGHKVAICEQTEDGKTGKATQEITRTVTTETEPPEDPIDIYALLQDAGAEKMEDAANELWKKRPDLRDEIDRQLAIRRRELADIEKEYAEMAKPLMPPPSETMSWTGTPLADVVNNSIATLLAMNNIRTLGQFCRLIEEYNPPMTAKMVVQNAVQVSTLSPQTFLDVCRQISAWFEKRPNSIGVPECLQGKFPTSKETEQIVAEDQFALAAQKATVDDLLGGWRTFVERTARGEARADGLDDVRRKVMRAEMCKRLEVADGELDALLVKIPEEAGDEHNHGIDDGNAGGKPVGVPAKSQIPPGDSAGTGSVHAEAGKGGDGNPKRKAGASSRKKSNVGNHESAGEQLKGTEAESKPSGSTDRAHCIINFKYEDDDYISLIVGENSDGTWRWSGGYAVGITSKTFAPGGRHGSKAEAIASGVEAIRPLVQARAENASGAARNHAMEIVERLGECNK